MMIKPLIKCFIALSLLVAAFGCSGNPTNEPSATDIKKANDDRAAAIDKDPNMSDADKAKMKEMMGLNGNRPGR